jgi:hypothetical protein
MKKSAGFLAILTAALLASAAAARTITLTTADCDEVAVLSALSPRMSWAITQGQPDIFLTQSRLLWNSKMTVLLRFPIQTLIPPGQRITKAEFTLVATYVSGLPVVQIRRALAEWGPGVCHQYRMTFPKKLEWSQPGGRGAAVDRAAKDIALFRVAKVGEYTGDVTEDIELWYTGAVPNRGWIMAFESEGHHIYLTSPYTPTAAPNHEWKLQLTFEPK